MDEKNCQKSFRNYFWEYIQQFCETTSIHGFKHLVAPERHRLEKVFWALIIMVATALAASIIYRTYTRYDNDPIVISIDKNYRNISVFMPATTVCLLSKLNETKAKEIIKSSYDNLKDFERFSNNSALNSENLGELMCEINLAFDPKNVEINTDSSITKPADFHETLTEMGICYSTFSYITYHLKPEKRLSQDSNINRILPSLETCHFSDGSCTVYIAGYTRPIKFYIHSPFDLPDSTSKYWIPPLKFNFQVSFSFISIKPHKPEKIRALKIKQRQCLFLDESAFPESPYYSLRLCRINCRRMLAMDLCNCIPHFYTRRANQPFCDLKGLACISNFSENITKLVTEKGENYHCTCYPSCDDSEYIFLEDAMNDAEGINSGSTTEATYGWKIKRFPKMALKIDILIGIEDLIVSVGSTAALFLGCSIMSFVEIIYHFTLRMIRYFYRVHKKRESDRWRLMKEGIRFNYFARENKKRKIFIFRELQGYLYD